MIGRNALLEAMHPLRAARNHYEQGSEKLQKDDPVWLTAMLKKSFAVMDPMASCRPSGGWSIYDKPCGFLK
jgi:hypothetical protein